MLCLMPRVGLKVFLIVTVLLGGCAEEVPTTAPETHRSTLAPTTLGGSEHPTTDDITHELRDSAHADLDCSDCHAPNGKDKSAQATDGKSIGKADCGHCHERQLKAFEQSIHADAARRGQTGAATCANCHGTHFILPPSNPRSTVFKRNLPETCGKCHKNPETAKKLGIKQPDAGAAYLDSLHGRALVQQGLLAAPSCADCHSSSHTIRSASDPRATVNRKNVPQTCGHCHAGPLDEYNTGIHGKKAAAGNAKAPVCSDCHTAHAIVGATNEFRHASDALCGKCHAERLKQYMQSYHGRAHDLGSAKVAACYDCHGTHAILPVSDPDSTLSTANRLGTCQRCHRGAKAKFTSFKAHADFMDRRHYPELFWAFVIMTSLIVGTFAVWGVHNLLWVMRTFVAYFTNPRAFRTEKQRVRDEHNAKLYTRFRPVDRFCHFLIIISFMILVCTGMPLKFHETRWAQAVFEILGGAHVAARLHRVGAILSFTYLFIHIASLVGPLRRKWSSFRDAHGRFMLRRLLAFVFGPDSPLPNFDDLRDIRDHFKYFVGRGAKPQFDRFTYWEKFDYFAELWGSAFIGISGLIMWFPVRVSYVLPGWIVNLAQIIHSQEALLAAGFILTFHFFNGHFRLEKFPIDTVMFSGRITEAEMRHERGRQYARLKAEGRLHELEARDDWQNWKYVFNTFGIVALIVGLLLATGIFIGLARHWFGR